MINPLTRCAENYALPPFAQLRVSDIVPAIRAAIQEYALDLNAIEDDLSFFQDDITWESVMDRLEIIDDPLNRLWRIVLHLSGVANSVELREAKAEVQAEVLAIQSRRQQSVEIFEAMQTLRDGPRWAELTSEQQRILDRSILEMKLNGVALTGAEKERFNEIDVRLKQLGDIFSNNLLDATKTSLVLHARSQLEGIDDSLFARDAVAAGYEGATAANGPWKILLDGKNTVPLLHNCSNASTREAVYRANRTRASREPHDNTSVIHEMLQLRRERANLLGYTTFAEMSLADKMAPSVEVVQEMLRELRDKCFEVSAVELRQLKAYAEAHGQVEPLQAWDIRYWINKMRNDKYALDNDLISAYFSLPSVLPGFLTSSPSSLTADESEETWHPVVLYYQIRALEQPGEPVIAQFYLDLYARPGEKKALSWIEVVAPRSRVLRTEKANIRIPVFALMFNQPAPVEGKPYLMPWFDVENLFFVLGYGLRIGLTAAEYTASSRPHGIEWDAVGFSAQFMHNFCYHRETLKSISCHVETGEPLPDEIFDRIYKSRTFMQATNFAEHCRSRNSDAMFDVFRRRRHEFTLQPPFHDDKFICALEHIFPSLYAASYYSYVWSEMLAADSYACFNEAANEEEWMALGRKYRDTILALTGPARFA
ncbi:hypothetical protein AC1031_019415 [Aphanomyces cochlioides]|nr:hypothetical protein AC1031_019415 [Aphanomyces cochlioides]